MSTSDRKARPFGHNVHLVADEGKDVSRNKLVAVGIADGRSIKLLKKLTMIRRNSIGILSAGFALVVCL